MSNDELVKLVFELVMKEIGRLDAEQARSAQIAGRSACDASSIELSKKVLSESDVRSAHRSGANEIIVTGNAIITCLADEYANKQGITITRKT